MATSYTYKPIVSDGLILYYDPMNTKSYVGSGTSVYDLTENYIDGVLQNGTSYDGFAFSFDSVDDYIDCGNSDILKFVDGDAFTLCAWIKINSNLITSHAIIMQHGGTPYSSTGFGLYVENSGFIDFAKSNVANTSQNTSTTYLSWDVWNYIVCSVKYDGTNGVIKFYINGDLRSTFTGWSANPIITDYTSPFYIGKSGVDLSFNNGMIFPGLISCVSVYNRLLNDDEVLQNYNALKNRFI